MRETKLEQKLVLTKKMKVPILTFLFLAEFCDSSPETEEKKNEEAGGNSSPPVPEGLCPLPKELGYSGILNSR